MKSLGYEHRDARYFAYFDKEKGEYIPLNYVQARKRIYFPEYAKLVHNTESFLYLKSLVDSGKKVALVDFDAVNYNEPCAMRKRYESYVNKCKQDKPPIIKISDERQVRCWLYADSEESKEV